MNNILLWLNENSGILNFLTVSASLIACIFGFRSAQAAWAQVREMQRQYQEENRPNIEVEFLYENRSFYGLRFVNHGKCTAQNVEIELDSNFIKSLPESNFSEFCKTLKQKTCVIGVDQHYDLFIGTNAYRNHSNKPSAKGKITYQANGKIYESEFDIDMENYAMIFSVESEQEKLLKVLKNQNQELAKLCKEIQGLKNPGNNDADINR